MNVNDPILNRATFYGFTWVTEGQTLDNGIFSLPELAQSDANSRLPAKTPYSFGTVYALSPYDYIAFDINQMVMATKSKITEIAGNGEKFNLSDKHRKILSDIVIGVIANFTNTITAQVMVLVNQKEAITGQYKCD